MTTDTPEADTRPGFPTLIGVGLIYLVFAVIASLGLLSLYSGIEMLWTGHETAGSAVMVIGIGLVFSLIGLGFFYIKFFQSKVSEARENRLKSLYPDQPWMLRDAWRARRVIHTNAGAMIFMWVWVAGWWSGIALIGRLNYDKIVQAMQDSWGDIAFAAVFVLAGIAGLLVAIKMTRTHLRFGRTSLVIDTLPGYIGDRFRGTVSAGLPKLPQQPLEAELLCELLTEKRRRVAGKNKTTIESTDLWREQERIFPNKLMPTGTRVHIPVSFDLPGNQPETEMNTGLGVCWTLHVRTTGKVDPAFSCSFEVPIFRKR